MIAACNSGELKLGRGREEAGEGKVSDMTERLQTIGRHLESKRDRRIVTQFDNLAN